METVHSPRQPWQTHAFDSDFPGPSPAGLGYLPRPEPDG